MCFPVRLVIAALFLGGFARAAQTPPVAEPDPTREQTEGRELAAEMRALRPAESFTNAASLRLTDADGNVRRIPLTIANVVTDADEWRVIYQARGATNETLVVTRHPERTPEYLVTVGRDGTPPVTTPGLSATAFAGSDFALRELGMEFLHWPEQRIIRRDKPEMRKGRSCRILESVNPSAPGYARVRSWVDLEHKGLLLAEAYDAKGRLVKRFSIGSLKKVDGVWQLRDMEMIDEVRGSETRLEFELKSTK
jgi:hypothetical protein